MKNVSRILTVALVASLFAVVITFCTAGGQTVAPAATAVAPAPAPATATATPDVKASWQAGVDQILSGKVNDGIASIQQAHKLAPSDSTSSAAADVIKEYKDVSDASEAQRRQEYAATVARVQRGMMAQEAVAGLGGLQKPIRDRIREMSTAYGKTATSEAFAEANDKTAQKMKETALAKLPEARAALAKAIEAASKAKPSEYTKSFAQLAQQADKALAAMEKVWKEAKIANEKEQKDTAVKLMEAEEPLLDALADLETVVAEQPWKIALIQARVARQIATPADKMKDQEWYKQLLASVQKHGEDSMETAVTPWQTVTAEADTKCEACSKETTKSAAPEKIIAKGAVLFVKGDQKACSRACANKLDSDKWYDALTAFAGLEDLEHDNKTYQEKSKEVRSHVRVLRLYGGNGTETAASNPATQPEAKDDDEDLNWKDLTKDIDLEMIRKAITKINSDYVTTPDFRKMTLGALRSVKVLAETPQSSHSFPKLANEDLRRKFVADIDRLIQNVKEKDNVDYLDLHLNLNNVVRASGRTVEIPTAPLAMEFADGFMSELDPFSNIIWPYDLNDFKKSTQGTFFGVGIQITKDEGEPLKVVTPLKDSPAYKAGIKTGDLILTVDGKSTREISLDKLIQMIMGKEGTKVTFEVERRGVVEPLKVDVERREISVQTVKGWKIKADGDYDYMLDPQGKIAYVRVTQFAQNTYADLLAVLKDLKAKGVTSLIVDLRFNPGGYLVSAGKVVDEFVNSGRIVSTAGQQQPNAQEIDARDGGEYTRGDLVVLVNENSASAAEIVSGALKDDHRAVIVGERSYGKGSVQNVMEVSKDKAFLKLTTAYYYLPSGRLLHRKNGSKEWGVDPDIRVSMTPKQMRRWLEIRRKTELLQETPGDELDNDLQNQFKADVQLNMAVTILRLKQLQGTPIVAEK